jgi:hypothetical protein
MKRAGLDLLLLQMSPQAEEMDRFAEQIIARGGKSARLAEAPARLGRGPSIERSQSRADASATAAGSFWQASRSGLRCVGIA